MKFVTEKVEEETQKKERTKAERVEQELKQA